MTIRERIATFILDSKTAAPPTINTQGGRRDRVDLSSFTKQVREGLYRNHAVQACINKRASTLNEPPLVAVDGQGNTVPNHALTRLFARPNPVMSQAQFWQYVSTYQDVGGNCYCVIVRNADGVPLELWPYNDGQMTPVCESGTWIDYYMYRVGQDERRIEVRDVIHFMSSLIDPLRPYKAMSPIELVSAYIDTMNEATETLRSVLGNNGVPSTLLFTPSNFTKEQKGLFRESWRESTEGRNRGKLAILQGEFKVERLGQNLDELDIANMLSPLEAAICAAFNVHPTVAGLWAGLTHSTYNNLETAYREYTTLTRIPQWHAWEGAVESAFRDMFVGINVEFNVSNVEALRSDPDPVIAQYNASLTTLNEARKKLGLPPTAGGDIYAVDRAIPAPTGFGAADTTLFNDKATTFESGRITHNEKDAVPYWKELDKLIEDASAQVLAATNDMIDEAYSGLGGKGVKKNPNEIKLELLVNRWMNSTGAVREGLLRKVLTLAMQAVGEDPSAISSFIDRAQKAMTRVLNENITTAAGTIKDDIIKTVADNAGKSSEEISTAIQSKKLAAKNNADRIGRTSFRAATSTAQTQTWSDVNAKQTDPNKRIVKVWLTRRDNKVRPSHEEMDGKWVEMGGQFTTGDGNQVDAPAVGGNDAPNDTINCRCVLRPMRYEKVKGKQ